VASSDNGKDSSTRGILREVLLLIFYVFLTFISVWVWRATSHPQLSGPARTDQHNSLQGEQPRELADDRNIDASENDFTLRLSKIMELRDSVEYSLLPQYSHIIHFRSHIGA